MPCLEIIFYKKKVTAKGTYSTKTFKICSSRRNDANVQMLQSTRAFVLVCKMTKLASFFRLLQAPSMHLLFVCFTFAKLTQLFLCFRF